MIPHLNNINFHRNDRRRCAISEGDTRQLLHGGPHLIVRRGPGRVILTQGG